MVILEIKMRIQVTDIARAKVIHDSLQIQAEAITEVVVMETDIIEQIKMNEE